MSVQIHIGRRTPRTWLRRTTQMMKGIITFQEHIWTIVKQSLSMAKRKANADGRLKFVMTFDKEIEDINYQIEWIKIVIQGTKEQEEEEYNEAMQLYSSLAKVLKKEIPESEQLKKHFKTKILSAVKVEEAYVAGMGSIADNNIANKLLEMGILTHIEWVHDFDTRDPEIPHFT